VNPYLLASDVAVGAIIVGSAYASYRVHTRHTPRHRAPRVRWWVRTPAATPPLPHPFWGAPSTGPHVRVYGGADTRIRARARGEGGG
jgi:hypothetical protein